MAQTTLNPNSVLTKAALGGQFKPEDSFIAVMGVTGSGKSTFISRVAEGDIKIGHDLASCTSDIESFDFNYNGHTIHLIDTPGFDDTYRTDSDVLKDIAFWLNAAYQSQIKLSGIVYLHPIDMNRMTGSASKNLRMFNKLCGDASLPTVVLATTMWKHVEEEEGIKRQEQLKSTLEFWGEMVSKGSRVFRHDDSRVSAMNIITYILDQKKTTVLQIQRQMVDEGKNLNETAAGQELEKELVKQRELFEKRLREAEQEMKEAMEEGNRRAIEEAAAQQERFQKKLNEALKGSQELNVSMQKLLEQKEAENKKTVEEFQLERQRSKEESELNPAKMEELKRQMKARDDDLEDQRRRHQSDMDEVNRKMAQENANSQKSFQEWMAAERLRLAQEQAHITSSGSTANTSQSGSFATSLQGQVFSAVIATEIVNAAAQGGCVMM